MELLDITDGEFTRIVTFLKERYGINLTQKRNLVVGRLRNYLHNSGYNSFDEFFNYVISDTTGGAVTLLLDKLTTNYTYFMRETEHFDYFRSTVLPYIASTARDKDMRIWSAGCSSGEEPYTIAMCVDSFFGGAKNNWDTKILATDISERVLSLAASGLYMNESLEALPPEWRKGYFTRVDEDSSRVVDKVRKEIIFRKFNLMEKSMPFRKKFHIIWCRNVMIYFDLQTKNALIERFYEVTEPGGYLFIGHSESITRNDTRYNYVKPAIYRK